MGDDDKNPKKPSWWNWLKKPWAIIVAVATVGGLFFLNINSVLTNARAFPSEVRKTSDQFFEWYGEYQAWKGRWSNNPEGFVDMAELNLSREEFRINIDETAGGEIAGTIETKGICEKTPIFEELLIDGSISSAHRATIEAFDFIGGYRRNFAKLTLRRDGFLMTVIPLDDPAGLFGKQTRIAHYPDELKLGDVEDTDLNHICAGKRAKFFTDLAKKFQERRSASPTTNEP